jgi:hypothetical protein
MADTTITGQVHLIEPTKSFGQKGFRKRLVVLEQTTGRFTNYIPLEFISDACDSVDDLKVGDKIKATYRLTGRKWQKDAMSEVKFFLSAEAMGFELLASGGGSSEPDRDDAPDFGPEDDSAPF